MPLLNQVTFHSWFSLSDALNGGEQARNNQTSMWSIRDRLFQTLFERLSATYAYSVPADTRKSVENAFLTMALIPLFVLTYVHVNFIRTPVSCLSEISDVWPRDGILRIEIAFNEPNLHPYSLCPYEGLSVRTLSSSKSYKSLIQVESRFCQSQANFSHKPNFSDIVSSISMKKEILNDFRIGILNPEHFESALNYLSTQISDGHISELIGSRPDYIIEYTLEYGFLKLSESARSNLRIPTLIVMIDPHDEKCFGNSFSQFLLKHVVGYSDVLMSGLKNLADKDETKGFVRNVKTGDQYRFVNKSLSWLSYGVAALTMVAFTLSISMLLRYSHYQIFMVIVQLLNVLESNANVSYPAASLLTVVFALVGMEAIMSEFFNDNTTAFYIILIVWFADQYDNICCHNVITKRHWLRFFYLYHFAFYAYDHRFNGQYSSLALLTSWMFIQHSMIYFYHRYELPLIPVDIDEDDLQPRNFHWTFNFVANRNFESVSDNISPSAVAPSSSQSIASPTENPDVSTEPEPSQHNANVPCCTTIN